LTKVSKINLGCGDHMLADWTNHDIKIDGIDLARGLPYETDTVQFVQAEHFIEHFTAPMAIGILKEIYRILKPGGVARISVPAIEKIANLPPAYEIFLRELLGGPLHTRGQSICCVIQNWGHLSAWTEQLLELCLKAVGFETVEPKVYGESDHNELKDIDKHSTEHELNERQPGIADILKLEAAIMEATK